MPDQAARDLQWRRAVAIRLDRCPHPGQRRDNPAHRPPRQGFVTGQHAVEGRIVDDRDRGVGAGVLGLVVHAGGKAVVGAPVVVRGGDDHALGYEPRAVETVAVENGLVPAEFAGQRPGVRVDQQFVGIAAQSLGGMVNAVDAIAVLLPGLAAGQVAVPDGARVAGQVMAGDGAAALVEQAQLDVLRDLGVDREVGAVLVRSGAEWSRAARLNHVSSLIGSACQISAL